MEKTKEIKIIADDVMAKINRTAENALVLSLRIEAQMAEKSASAMSKCIADCENEKFQSAIDNADLVLLLSKNIEQRLAAYALKKLAKEEDKEGIAKMLEAGYDFDDNLVK